DRVVVINDGAAVLGDELVARRLNGAGLVDGARLEHRWTAVPLPRQAKARERPRQYRRRQRRLRPALAAVGGNLDPPDRAAARPGDAGNFVEPRTLQR